MTAALLRAQLVRSLMTLGNVPADSEVATALGSALKLAGTEILLAAGGIFDRASDPSPQVVSSANIVMAKAALARANEALAAFEKTLRRTVP